MSSPEAIPVRDLMHTPAAAGGTPTLLAAAGPSSDAEHRGPTMISAPAPSRTGSQTDLPPEVEQLLLGLIDDGFTLYCCRGRHDPTALVASYQWERYLDLVTIRDFNRITSARVPKHGDVDVFAPDTVVWAYQGCPEWALRALLDLVHPDHPDALTTCYPAPRSLHVPRHEQRPLTIRLPSAARAGARATRLAAAMTSAHPSYGR
jgi:hypothetical protein